MHISGCALKSSLSTLRSGGERLASAAAAVDRIEEEIPYEHFHLEYLLNNAPCIFGKWVTQNWKSVASWVSALDTGSEDPSPNFRYLEQKFGSAVVPVAACSQKYYNGQEKHERSFCDYLTYWKKYRINDHSNNQPCLYLKDWHFSRAFSEYEAYRLPVYFQNDWLNEFWDSPPNCYEDDYRFVYMGPKGSWTPFHADVHASYSWSANICGRKKWILYPPGEEEKLRDKNGILAYDINSSSVKDQAKYPHAHLATNPIIVIQEAGEVIFVPSGWHHQVHNLEDTISINHNWANACNFSLMWKFLCSELEAVEMEIKDCRASMTLAEWLRQCQVIMKAASGIDFAEFVNLMKTIAMPRVHCLNRMLFFMTNDCKDCEMSAELREKEIDIFRPELLNRLKKHDDVQSSPPGPKLSMEYRTKDDLCYFQAILDLCIILGVLDEMLQNPVVIGLRDQKENMLVYAGTEQLFREVLGCLRGV